MNGIIYLDNNATTPMDEAVLAAMLPWFGAQFGNPASGHALGRAARDAVEQSRDSVARLIGAQTGQIIFTSSATESNNLAIAGLTASHARRCHILASAIEHKSVSEAILRLERIGRASVTWLQPDSWGEIHADALDAAARAATRRRPLAGFHSGGKQRDPHAQPDCRVGGDLREPRASCSIAMPRNGWASCPWTWIGSASMP